MSKTVVLALFIALIPLAYADQGGFANSGGSASAGSGIFISSTVASPPGILNLTCPGSGGSCSGGTFTFVSNDGTIGVTAAFSSGTYAESCSGGGKGGKITCGYTLTGYLSGTWTVNSSTQAITGATSQTFSVTNNVGATGTTAFNSAYAAFYYSDSQQILRSDDLQGDNQITYGTQGSGTGQFYGAYGLALDSSGRIYIADTYNCRIVRIDDMHGTNWVSYGSTCGSGQGQFANPAGIALDSSGRIYVMDSGNFRVVRIDDLTGTNWIAYGASGSGTGQFAPNLTSIAVDSSSRIYVADTGNARIVRMDDMTGTNWTTLSQAQSNSLRSPAAVALDSAGKIYIADNESLQPAVIRVDDMTGANWTSVGTGAGTGLNSISVDPSGTVFLAGGGAKVVDEMTTVLNSSGAIGPIGPSYVFAATPIRLPSPRPSAISVTPSSLTFTANAGTTSPPQPVSIVNFGGQSLNFGSISANSPFLESNNCPSLLVAGSNCTVNVSFAPTVAGQATGQLTVTDDSGNLGTTQPVSLSGSGTTPNARVSPLVLTFSAQPVGSRSTFKAVTLQNNGSGPVVIASVVASAPFNESNNCNGSVAPNSSCTILVSFSPVAIGVVTGSLTVTDNAGTQTVVLSGVGTTPVTISPGTLVFGTVTVGTTSAPKTATLTNNQTAALNFSSIATSAGFTIASNTCGTRLSGGSSCTIGVTFSPTATGSASGTLTFTDDAVNSPQTVNLSGTGGGLVTLSPTSLSFGFVAVGNTSSAKTVTLTNNQSATLNFTNIAVSGSFAIASNTCGTSVGAGLTCTVGVTFSPTAQGAATGTLTFSDDAPNSPQTVSLSGTGRSAGP